VGETCFGAKAQRCGGASFVPGEIVQIETQPFGQFS